MKLPVRATANNHESHIRVEEMFRTLIAFLAALSIAGCATTYFAPPGASTARVKFIADPGPNNNAYFLNVKPGPDCTKSIGQSLARLGAAINRDGATEYERTIESGEDIRIFAHWLQSYNPYGSSYDCKIGARISLLPGRKYELRFKIANSCSVHLYELHEMRGEISSTEQQVIGARVENSKDLCDL